jgi:hypothetical protein
MAKKVYGKCALCGKEGELSFEHIPPKAAFNNIPAKPVSGIDLLTKGDRYPWETKGVPYQNLQQGMGLYSLCDRCNPFTGSAYGDYYKDFAQKALFTVTSLSDPAVEGVVFQNIYPLRVIKQIVSMFCSTTPIPGIDDLKAFVLDKEMKGIDHRKYSIRMYFTKDDVIKWTGYNMICKVGEPSIVKLSEITAFPLGFILYFDPEEIVKPEGIDITCFADYGYNEQHDVVLPLVIRSVNTAFPGDYRSKEEIISTVERNRKWERMHGEE